MSDQEPKKVVHVPDKKKPDPNAEGAPEEEKKEGEGADKKKADGKKFIGVKLERDE